METKPDSNNPGSNYGEAPGVAFQLHIREGGSEFTCDPSIEREEPSEFAAVGAV